MSQRPPTHSTGRRPVDGCGAGGPPLPKPSAGHKKQGHDGGSSLSARRRRGPAGVPAAGLPKGATFHTPPSSPRKEEDGAGAGAGAGAGVALPIRNAPATLRRSPSAPSTHEEVVAAGERRMAAFLDSIEPDLAGLESREPKTPPSSSSSEATETALTANPGFDGSPLSRAAEEDDLPVPRGILDAGIPPTNSTDSVTDSSFTMDGPPKNNHDNHNMDHGKEPERPVSDSGLGTSVDETNPDQWIYKVLQREIKNQEELDKQRHHVQHAPTPGPSTAPSAGPSVHPNGFLAVPGAVSYAPVPASVSSHGTASVKRGLEGPDEDVMRCMGRRKKNAPPDTTVRPCRHCPLYFPRNCDRDKHEKTHSRPWKCSDESCDFADKGWPTEKERDRHWNDKHNPHATLLHCKVSGCTHESKRRSNLMQHMEKKHGVVYERKKGSKKGSKKSTRAAPNSSQSTSPMDPPINNMAAHNNLPVGYLATPAPSLSPGPTPPNPNINMGGRPMSNSPVGFWDIPTASSSTSPTSPNPNINMAGGRPMSNSSVGFWGIPAAGSSTGPTLSNPNDNMAGVRAISNSTAGFWDIPTASSSTGPTPPNAPVSMASMGQFSNPPPFSYSATPTPSLSADPTPPDRPLNMVPTGAFDYPGTSFSNQLAYSTPPEFQPPSHNFVQTVDNAVDNATGGFGGEIPMLTDSPIPWATFDAHFYGTDANMVDADAGPAGFSPAPNPSVYPPPGDFTLFQESGNPGLKNAHPDTTGDNTINPALLQLPYF